MKNLCDMKKLFAQYVYETTKTNKNCFLRHFVGNFLIRLCVNSIVTKVQQCKTAFLNQVCKIL